MYDYGYNSLLLSRENALGIRLITFCFSTAFLIFIFLLVRAAFSASILFILLLGRIITVVLFVRSYNDGGGCSVGGHIKAGNRRGRSAQRLILTLMEGITCANGRTKPSCEPCTNKCKDLHLTTTTHLQGAFEKRGCGSGCLGTIEHAT